MPQDKTINSVLIIGSGPIVIGQACEFDYSGTQSIKALKSSGIRVILLNSNPATIMTDPGLANATYIEPITVEALEKIIIKEHPDAILPTMGGQTALNLVIDAEKRGVFERYPVRLLGADIKTIKKAEDRALFKQAMQDISLDVLKSEAITDIKQAENAIGKIGYPVIIRPAYTLGGTGGSIAYNEAEFYKKVRWGIDISPIGEVLLEESALGWKEYELEVMRDKKDNVVIICSIENLDPMGIHTGDSITVAPVMTLTDKEYQIMRDAAIAVIREIGVETGGSNIQFAVNPKTGRMVIVEMNPRVSRSSALASKATGFPIAKIAALLSIGYTLDEIPNDITGETYAAFEPSLDYVVVKFPRFTFEKFPDADNTLTTQMKSVGEVMAIGRTFKEALLKSIRSLEIDRYGFESPEFGENFDEAFNKRAAIPTPERIWYIAEAYRRGYKADKINSLTGIDMWFLNQIEEAVEVSNRLTNDRLNSDLLRQAKETGFSDRYIGRLTGTSQLFIRKKRNLWNIKSVFRMVDTCAAEFSAKTPYFYSTYENEENESIPSKKKKILIIGSGPNRIGQGIEFDYCCCHAAFALKEAGIESIMVNCNPETVSTDYDTSDRLYFEPITFEDVMSIIENEKPDGVILQFGGQTPLKLANSLKEAGVPIIGTDPESIDIAEDRKRFGILAKNLNIRQPENGLAATKDEAMKIVERIGYPVIVRPSYVLGGRAMEICYDKSELEHYIEEAVYVSGDHPLLVDRFLENAVEIDVDAVVDGTDVVICAIMEHIEEAGVHSGDSACSIPTRTIPEKLLDTIKNQTKNIGLRLKVKGLMNIQYAIKDGQVYLLEVNPRSSRTVPFASKATGVAWVKVATEIMLGKSLKELGIKEITPTHFSVKEVVLPFIKFSGTDVILGPEMRSTGEVMGTAKSFEEAFYKAQISSNNPLPNSGTVFLSVSDPIKKSIIYVAEQLKELGIKICATRGTAKIIAEHGIDVDVVKKYNEGRPNIVDIIKNHKINFIINIPQGRIAKKDSFYIRNAAIVNQTPYCTTLSEAKAIIASIRWKYNGNNEQYTSLQSLQKK